MRVAYLSYLPIEAVRSVVNGAPAGGYIGRVTGIGSLIGRTAEGMLCRITGQGPGVGERTCPTAGGCGEDRDRRMT